MTTSSMGGLLVCTRRLRAPALRLICLPYAGGGASAYRGWSDLLPREVELHAVQLPGREWRIKEPVLNRIEPIVDSLISEMIQLFDRPFALFGHSMGALLGFEVARGLRRLDKPAPSRLFVSGYPAPQIPRRTPPTTQTEGAASLKDMLEGMQGTPKEVLENEEMLELILPAIKGDLEVCRNYRYLPEHPLDCPITAFGGLADDLAKQEGLEKWGVQTRADFKLRMLPGSHFFVHQHPELVIKAIVSDTLIHG